MESTMAKHTWSCHLTKTLHDASEDKMSVIFVGHDPDALVCDTTLREMPDGTWVLVMLGGGMVEPLPANRISILGAEKYITEPVVAMHQCHRSLVT